MPHRPKLLVFATLAMLAFAAISSAAACAEENGLPSILPTPLDESPAYFTTQSLGAGVLKGVAELESPTLEGDGAFASARLGMVALKFTGTVVKGTKTKCKSKEATTTEEVLVFADMHLVDLEIEGDLELGVAFIILGERGPNAGKSVVITCGVVKVEVKGAVIGLVDRSGTSEALLSLEKVTKVLVLFKESGGRQAIKTCHLTKEFCEGKTYELLSSTGGEFKEAIEIVDIDIIFIDAIEIHF